MKRIVFFGIKTFPSRGATDRVAENIMLQLKERYKITVYCFRDPSAVKHMPGVRVVQFRRILPGAPGSLIYFFMSALYLMLFDRADLVHIHKTESSIFGPLFRLRFKVIATSHEAQYKSDKWKPYTRWFFHLAERIFVYGSDVPTCISQPLTNYYNSRYGNRVKFIPNAINAVQESDFDFDEAKKFLPATADWDKPFILFSARRIMRIKGAHLMLRALKKIDFKGQIFITGDLHTTNEYLQELRELSEGLNVHFLGLVHPLPALLALIKKSQLFIFPSKTEGMSIQLLEVASVGSPIIASDIPENTQVFSDEEVLYFTSKDSDDLSEKIKFALSHKAEMEQLGIKARNLVYSDYLWPKVAAQYAQVYDSLLKN